MRPKFTWRFELDYAGSIALADKRIFVGAIEIESGGNSLVCLDLETGAELWRSFHQPTFRPRGFPNYPITSTPAITGDFVYYVSTNWEFVCVDAEGFRDGKNDGPFQEESDTSESAADFIWKIDLIENLGIKPRMAGDIGYLQPSPVIAGDRVFLVTGNGSDNWRQGTLAPEAPSFLAVNLHNGEVIWQSSLPGDGIHWMQGGTPIPIDEQLILFPGGDGIIYALRQDNGDLIGMLDLNKVSGTEHKFFTNGFVGSDRTLIATVGEGMEFLVGSKLSQPLVAIDIDRLTPEGSEEAVRWIYRKELGRIWGAPRASGGTVFTNFFPNRLVALDVEDGAVKWETPVGWSSDRINVYTAPLVVGDRLYVTSDSGDLNELSASSGEVLRHWEFDEAFSEHATPIPVQNGLILATDEAVYLLELDLSED